MLSGFKCCDRNHSWKLTFRHQRGCNVWHFSRLDAILQKNVKRLFVDRTQSCN